MQVGAVLNSGAQYQVTRAQQGTAAAAQNPGTMVYILSTKTVIAPFPRDFFGSPYAGSWAYPISLPDVRVVSAELFMSNSLGNGATASIHLTNNDDLGLRTFSGGQYSIQVSGFLAVDANAAPPLVVEASHSVRDIYAVLGTAADAPVTLLLQSNGAPYCTVNFPSGGTLSNAVDGNTLPPLLTGAQLTLSVETVGTLAPGADLTVLIRL